MQPRCAQASLAASLLQSELTAAASETIAVPNVQLGSALPCLIRLIVDWRAWTAAPMACSVMPFAFRSAIAWDGVMAEVYASAYFGQCGKRIVPTNGMREHPLMTQLSANLRYLIPGRQANAVAKAAGVHQSWLHRVMNPDSEGGIREPRDSRLEPLARYFGLTVQQLKHADLAGGGESVSPSRDTRFDPVILTRAYRELVALYREAGIGLVDLSEESNSAVLCSLYEKMQANGGYLSARDGYELVNYVRQELGNDDAARDSGAEGSAGKGRP